MGNYLIKKQGKFPVFTIRFIRISCRSFFAMGLLSHFFHILQPQICYQQFY